MPSQSASDKSAIRAPRLERGRSRVAALLAAGAAVFADKGYDAATMTEIAAVAGASIGSLYQFFPTKELLAAAMHAALLDGLSALLDDLRLGAAGQSAAALADAMLERLAAFLTGHPAFVALAERRDIDAARKQATKARLRGQITALLMQATPPLPRARAETMAIIILHMMKVVVFLSGSEDEPTRDAVMTELRQMLRTHLSRPVMTELDPAIHAAP